MAQLEWELIRQNIGLQLRRAKVPGGWLLRQSSADGQSTPALLFLADPQHGWDVDTDPVASSTGTTPFVRT